MIDEGPSDADLDRFSGDTAHCPHCGAEIYDLAEFCPECGEHVAGRTAKHHPADQWLTRRWWALVAVIVVLAMLWPIIRLLL